MIVDSKSKNIIIRLLNHSYQYSYWFQNSVFVEENLALIEAYSASQAQTILIDTAQLILELKQAITQHPKLIAYLEPTHNDYKELVLTAVTQDGWVLQYASEELRADREVVMAAVQQNGWALEFASAELQADRDVVLVAGGYALQYASVALKADRDVVITAVAQQGWALEYASAELKADRDVVMAAIKQNGCALSKASAELKADREIVMMAVAQHGEALLYASTELKANPEVVMAAMTQAGYALQWASAELQMERNIIIAAYQSNVEALYYAQGDYASCPQIIHDTLKRDYRAIFFINKNNIFNQLSKELQDHINKCIVQFESIPIIEYDELCYTNWLLDEEDESGETHHVIYDYDKNQITSIEVFEQKFKAKYFDPKNIKYSQESKAQQLLNQVKRLADQVCHELGNTPLNEYLIDKAEVEKKQTQSYALLSTLFSKKTGANAYDMQKTQIHTTTSMAQETTSSESTATPGPESIVVQYLTAHDILFRLIPTRKVPQPNHVTYHDPTQHVAKKPTLM